MKAAIFYGKDKPFQIEDVSPPSIGDDDALVKVAACGLCRTDLHYLHGTPTFKQPPLILGHEVSGIVEEIGSNVSGLKKGDRVLVPPVFSCGKCQMCRSGRGTLCTNQVMIGNHRDGGFAEFISVPANSIFILPSEIPLEEGAIISDALSTPYHAVVNRAEVRPGEYVVVFGCGGVGLATVQMAAAAGGLVIAVDIFDEKLALAKKFGAVETINAKTELEVAKKIRKLTITGADVAMEVIGNPVTIQQAMVSVRWGGRVIIVGYCHHEVPMDAPRVMFRELEIRGSLGCGAQDFPKLIALIKAGRLKVRELVTHRYKLEELNKGYEMLDSGEPTMIRGIAVP